MELAKITSKGQITIPAPIRKLLGVKDGGKPGLFHIRDINDYPVLYTAIVEDTDILITGDKDFAQIEIEKPEILTPTEFLEKYA